MTQLHAPRTAAYSQLTRHADGSATLAVHIPPADLRALDAIADSTPRSTRYPNSRRPVYLSHAAIFLHGSATTPQYEWGYVGTPMVPTECWQDETADTDVAVYSWRPHVHFPRGGYWYRTTYRHSLDTQPAAVGAQ
jgi:hypothetical protein